MTYEELIRLGVEGSGKEKAMRARREFLMQEVDRLEALIQGHKQELQELYYSLSGRVPAWLQQIQEDIEKALAERMHREAQP